MEEIYNLNLHGDREQSLGYVPLGRNMLRMAKEEAEALGVDTWEKHILNQDDGYEIRVLYRGDGNNKINIATRPKGEEGEPKLQRTRLIHARIKITLYDNESSEWKELEQYRKDPSFIAYEPLPVPDDLDDRVVWLDVLFEYDKGYLVAFVNDDEEEIVYVNGTEKDEDFSEKYALRGDITKSISSVEAITGYNHVAKIDGDMSSLVKWVDEPKDNSINSFNRMPDEEADGGDNIQGFTYYNSYEAPRDFRIEFPVSQLSSMHPSKIFSLEDGSQYCSFVVRQQSTAFSWLYGLDGTHICESKTDDSGDSLEERYEEIVMSMYGFVNHITDIRHIPGLSSEVHERGAITYNFKEPIFDEDGEIIGYEDLAVNANSRLLALYYPYRVENYLQYDIYNNLYAKPYGLSSNFFYLPTYDALQAYYEPEETEGTTIQPVIHSRIFVDMTNDVLTEAVYGGELKYGRAIQHDIAVDGSEAMNDTECPSLYKRLICHFPVAEDFEHTYLVSTKAPYLDADSSINVWEITSAPEITEWLIHPSRNYYYPENLTDVAKNNSGSSLSGVLYKDCVGDSNFYIRMPLFDLNPVTLRTSIPKNITLAVRHFFANTDNATTVQSTRKSYYCEWKPTLRNARKVEDIYDGALLGQVFGHDPWLRVRSEDYEEIPVETSPQIDPSTCPMFQSIKGDVVQVSLFSCIYAMASFDKPSDQDFTISDNHPLSPNYTGTEYPKVGPLNVWGEMHDWDGSFPLTMKVNTVKTKRIWPKYLDAEWTFKNAYSAGVHIGHIGQIRQQSEKYKERGVGKEQLDEKFIGKHSASIMQSYDSELFEKYEVDELIGMQEESFFNKTDTMESAIINSIYKALDERGYGVHTPVYDIKLQAELFDRYEESYI